MCTDCNELTIPQGNPGNQGIQGIQGIAGTNGINGTTVEYSNTSISGTDISGLVNGTAIQGLLINGLQADINPIANGDEIEYVFTCSLTANAIPLTITPKVTSNIGTSSLFIHTLTTTVASVFEMNIKIKRVSTNALIVIYKGKITNSTTGINIIDVQSVTNLATGITVDILGFEVVNPFGSGDPTGKLIYNTSSVYNYKKV